MMQNKKRMAVAIMAAMLFAGAASAAEKGSTQLVKNLSCNIGFEIT